MPDTTPAGRDALAAGWAWLSTLSRAAVAHAERGQDPLAAVTGLLNALGNPHRRLRVIHIAGSKGKGSTALFLEALLAESGLRTFTYTSPHLERWTERLRLDGTEADPERALAALEAVQRARHDTGITPGFFEALTVAGLWLAAESGVDWAIVEAGVGGRADATNAVEPALCIVTGIEFEHADRLGGTLAAITREKAGIAKAGVPLLAPLLEAPLDAILAGTVSDRGGDLVRVRAVPRPPRAAGQPQEVRWHHANGTLYLAGNGWSLRTGLRAPGSHMAGNAALALAGVARLGLLSRETLQRSARAIADLELPGRMETVSELPWVIVDGAHTRASAEALVAAIADLAPGRIHLLLSTSAGKDIEALLATLLPIADAVTVTRADADYSLEPARLAEAVRRWNPAIPLHTDPDPESALGHAVSDQPGGTLVLATGSVYLAGRVRALLKTHV